MPTVAPHDPVPLDPHHEHIGDGAHLVLRWEPAPGAARYRVQIALDPGCNDVVYELDLPATMTAHAVRQHVPEDDRMFYWRTLASNAGGWSEGERIESFISGRAEQVDRFADPSESEPLGPIGALFSAAALEAMSEVLPGRQPDIEKALGEEHPEGVEAAQVFTIGLGLLIAGAIVIAVVLFVLFSSW